MGRETLEHSLELHLLRLRQRGEQILLTRLNCALGFYEASLAFGGQLDQMTPAVGRVARADDEPVPFERVEQAHKVAWIDPEGGAELLLRERSRLLEVVKDSELVSSHVERGKGLAQAVARRPGKPEDQERAAIERNPSGYSCVLPIILSYHHWRLY
jgi:hypothetical protein